MQIPIHENLAAVRARIERAALAVGRPAAEVRLLPVTKAVDVASAGVLWELGEREFGENRADGLHDKAAAFAARGRRARWHFIGHLQTNKVRRVLQHADVIHAVDSLHLLEALERVAGEESRRPEIYLQVNLTGEANKHGFDHAGLLDAVRRAADLRNVELVGIMAMGPLQERPGYTTSEVFERVARLASELEARELEGRDKAALRAGRCRLSMGMSADLECAVAHGSHVVRIGSDLFRESPADDELSLKGKAT